MAKRNPSSRTVPRPKALQLPAKFERVAAAFTRRKGVTLDRGWRADGAVLKTNGKIFAMLHDGNLVAKLPKASVDSVVEQKKGHRFDPRRDGRVMKEWVVVASGSIDWITLAEEAYAFAQQGAKKERMRT